MTSFKVMADFSSTLKIYDAPNQSSTGYHSCDWPAIWQFAITSRRSDSHEGTCWGHKTQFLRPHWTANCRPCRESRTDITFHYRGHLSNHFVPNCNLFYLTLSQRLKRTDGLHYRESFSAVEGWLSFLYRNFLRWMGWRTCFRGFPCSRILRCDAKNNFFFLQRIFPFSSAAFHELSIRTSSRFPDLVRRQRFSSIRRRTLVQRVSFN